MVGPNISPSIHCARFVVGFFALAGAAMGGRAVQAETMDPQVAATQPAAIPADAIDEVIVKVRRREERAQDVPIALTVFGGAALESANIYTLDQLKQQVPSLQITALNPRNTSINIRGLGSNASVSGDGLESGVGVYVDDVYYGRPGQSTFDFIDINQVEILRGPQGTLFGKNTTAGAISISTAAPSFDFGGAGEVSFGNYAYLQARAAVTGPLIDDKLAFRVTGSETRRDGTVQNVRTSQDILNLNSQVVRGQLLFTPTDNFTIRAIADFSRRAERCCVGLIAGVATTLPNGSPIPNNFATRAARFSYQLPSTNAFDRVTDIDSPARYVVKQSGGSAQMDWALPDLKVTSITAYRTWDWLPNNDFDSIGLPVLTILSTNSHQKQFSQELRAASTDNEFVDYVAGLYYFHQRLASQVVTEYGSAAPDFVLSPSIPAAARNAALNGFRFDSDNHAITNSYAAFGQGTWRVNSRLSFTAGLRYTLERKHGDFAQGQTAGVNLSTVPVAIAAAATTIRNTIGPVSAYAARTRENKLSGQASIAYKLSDEVLGYGSYARGYKSGGLNISNLPAGVSPVVKPEAVDSYEAGTKAAFFNKRLVINTAAFWTEIANYQATYADAATTTTYLTNAAKVRSRGAEVEAVVHVFAGLGLRGSTTYAETIYLSYPNAPCSFGRTASCALTGETLPSASRWAVSGGGEYRHALSFGGRRQIDGYVGADYSYRSSYNGASDNSAYGPISGYGIVNTRLGVRDGAGGWDAYIWAQNLFDKAYFQRLGLAPFNTGLLAASIGDPRTFGATVRALF